MWIVKKAGQDPDKAIYDDNGDLIGWEESPDRVKIGDGLLYWVKEET